MMVSYLVGDLGSQPSQQKYIKIIYITDTPNKNKLCDR